MPAATIFLLFLGALSSIDKSNVVDLMKPALRVLSDGK
jgi:hypothetical protein